MNKITPKVIIEASGETLGDLVLIKSMINWHISELENKNDNRSCKKLIMLKETRSKVENWIDLVSKWV